PIFQSDLVPKAETRVMRREWVERYIEIPLVMGLLVLPVMVDEWRKWYSQTIERWL
ncbi:hypothetical protein LCGC14_2040970, partial [marine sediment metagenome]